MTKTYYYNIANTSIHKGIIMKKLNTQLLLNELRESSNIEQYVSRFEKDLNHFELKDYLVYLLEVKNLKKSNVITDSKLHRTYAYQVFSGSKTPSRDKTLLLAFGFKLTPDETSRLLSYAQYSPLYPRNKRDAIILFGLLNHLGVDNTNDLLYDINQPLLE